LSISTCRLTPRNEKIMFCQPQSPSWALRARSAQLNWHLKPPGCQPTYQDFLNTSLTALSDTSMCSPLVPLKFMVMSYLHWNKRAGGLHGSESEALHQGCHHQMKQTSVQSRRLDTSWPLPQMAEIGTGAAAALLGGLKREGSNTNGSSQDRRGSGRGRSCS